MPTRPFRSGSSTVSSTRPSSDATVKALAETVASNAPLTIKASKEMVRRIQVQRRMAAVDGRDLIVTCYTSADFKEGVSAFLEKRPPKWTGS